MIDQIRGSVIAVEHHMLSLLVHDTISFIVGVPDANRFTINQPAHLYIHFYWHQEHGPALYGFATHRDRHVFQLIIGCAGIGPKIGLAVLNTMSAHSFVGALMTNNIDLLSSVPGIGKKKAEGIILNLKDKAAKLFENGIIDGTEHTSAHHMHEVAQTLSSLSYSKQEISAALDYVKKHEDCAMLPFDSLLRKTLLFLSKRM